MQVCLKFLGRACGEIHHAAQVILAEHAWEAARRNP